MQADSPLVHYVPAKLLMLACDALQYGIGAVLSHVTVDQQERLVAYASRALTAAEKNYSQLEKEALAIIFAVKKLYNYIMSRHFELESDHCPFLFLFSENKQMTPMMISSYLTFRLQPLPMLLWLLHQCNLLYVDLLNIVTSQ